MDLEGARVVSESEGQRLADDLGIGFVETSAKLGMNVDRAFEELVRCIPRTSTEYKVTHCGFLFTLLK